MLHIPTSPNDQVQISLPSASGTVTGLNLVHTKRTAVERAFLAADLHSGRICLVKPTVTQSAELAGVSRHYASMALMAGLIQRRRVECGLEPLRTPLARQKNSNPTPVEWWNGASEDEREKFIRAVGTESIWSTIEAVI